MHPLRLRYLSAMGLLPLAACGEPSTECIVVDDTATECPSASEAADQLVGDHCGYSVTSVTGEGELESAQSGYDTGTTFTQCCYPVTKVEHTMPTCVVGRAYCDDEGLKTAGSARGKGWARGKRPALARLTPVERAVLAEAWTTDALVEHASVAAFARTSLELLAVGAPAALLAGVQAAAADEVRHAELSFALASTYAGHAVGPAGFPIGPMVAIETDLVRLAVSTFREGCVGETVVAMLSARAAADAEDPAVVALLRLIARDEARHAELAWRTLAWMVEAGGARVREALAAELPRLESEGVRLPATTGGATDAVLRAHGRIRADAAADTSSRALREVVIPCLAALLSQPASIGSRVGAEVRSAAR